MYACMHVCMYACMLRFRVSVRVPVLVRSCRALALRPFPYLILSCLRLQSFDLEHNNIKIVSKTSRDRLLIKDSSRLSIDISRILSRKRAVRPTATEAAAATTTHALSVQSERILSFSSCLWPRMFPKNRCFASSSQTYFWLHIMLAPLLESARCLLRAKRASGHRPSSVK